MALAIVAGFVVCLWERPQGGAVSLRSQNSWDSSYLCEQGWGWGAGTQDLIPGAVVNWKEGPNLFLNSVLANHCVVHCHMIHLIGQFHSILF